MKKLQGKCQEFIEKEYCLGCARLENPDFIGDDKCPYIEQMEIYLKGEKAWMINIWKKN